jgi:hypothetical protein
MAVSIMAQLINHARALDTTIHTALLNTLKTIISEGAAYSDRGRNINSVWQAFGSMLQKYPHTITIIIDALDECTDPSQVTKLLFSSYITDQATKFLITGRPSANHCFEDQSSIARIQMDTKKHSDIALYVQKEVEMHSSLKRHADLIIDTVQKHSEGMFRYAVMLLYLLNCDCEYFTIVL